MRMWLYKLYQSVGTSLWLIPVLCVLIGALISFATIALDRANDYQLIPPSLIGGPDARHALGILTTVATSMVSLTALVLTIVLVVVQLAMGQFSPRIVQRLLRDRPSQLAIGLFVATLCTPCWRYGRSSWGIRASQVRCRASPCSQPSCWRWQASPPS